MRPISSSRAAWPTLAAVLAPSGHWDKLKFHAGQLAPQTLATFVVRGFAEWECLLCQSKHPKTRCPDFLLGISTVGDLSARLASSSASFSLGPGREFPGPQHQPAKDKLCFKKLPDIRVNRDNLIEFAKLFCCSSVTGLPSICCLCSSSWRS